jgi:hypothetical protein
MNDAKISRIAKIIAREADFYVDQDDLWDKHWAWFLLYHRQKVQVGGGLEAYQNHKKWYDAACEIMQITGNGDSFKVSFFEEENTRLKSAILRQAEEINELTLDIEDLEKSLEEYEAADEDDIPYETAEVPYNRSAILKVRREIETLRNGSTYSDAASHVASALESICNILDQ